MANRFILGLAIVFSAENYVLKLSFMRRTYNVIIERLRRLAYVEKWLILGVAIGIVSSSTTLLFYLLLMFVAGIGAWILGVVDNPLNWGLPDFSLAAQESGNKFLIPLLVVLGALLSSIIVYRFEPLAEGPGVSTTIKAYHRGAVLRKRLPLIKALASALLIGFGGSGGVQGPSIQIGAGVGSIIARFLRLGFEDRRLAIVAGMAGALSAIFRSPIGAALFAVEVLYRKDIESEALVPSVISSVTSYTFALYVVGFKGLFPPIPVNVELLFTYQGLITYLLLGLFSAFTAYLYIKFYGFVKKLFLRLKVGEIKILKPVIGAFILGLLGLLVPIVMGSGNIFISKFIAQSIEGKAYLSVLGLGFTTSLLVLIVLKILGTSFSIGSGGSGGLFAPSIFIGALLGYLVGIYFYPFTGIEPYVYAYIGMASLFGAATKTPLSTSIMIAEMSNSYVLAIPALLSSIIASELIGNETLYDAQPIRRISPRLASIRFLLDIVSRHRDAANINVESLVNTEYEAVKLSDTLSRVLELMVKGKQRVIPVVDDSNRVIGVIDSSSLRRALEVSNLKLSLRQVKVKLSVPPIVRVDENLQNVVDKMLKHGVDYAIVVDKEDRYVGVILAEEIVTSLAYYVAGLE